MNKKIADGFNEELSKINADEKYEAIIWRVVRISGAVASCWPEWRLRDNFYTETALVLGRTAASSDADFDKNLRSQIAELRIFLTNIPA